MEVLASAPFEESDKMDSRDGTELVTAKITVGFGGHTYEMTTRNQNRHLELPMHKLRARFLLLHQVSGRPRQLSDLR